MSDEVIITTLVENSVNVAGLHAEHGFSLLIRSGGRKVLFDTGQSDLVLHNAQRMGLALQDIEAVVLSHGHYDHTGGVQSICQAAPQARFYAHPGVLSQKFTANSDGTSRFIGLAPNAAELLRRPERQVVWTTKTTEVLPGLFATGEIPRTNRFEDTGGRFFLDAACTQPDLLPDDQALYFDTEAGLVVLVGCAHAGIVNTMAFISNLSGNRPFHAIIGGIHLSCAGPERLKATTEAFHRWHPKHLILGHCTGSSALGHLWNAFPGCCCTCAVGTSRVFQKRHV